MIDQPTSPLATIGMATKAKKLPLKEIWYKIQNSIPIKFDLATGWSTDESDHPQVNVPGVV